MKLELGDKATPFVSPNPALELLKCQRYYIRRDMIWVHALNRVDSRTYITCTDDSTNALVPNMRAIPSVTFRTDELNVFPKGPCYHKFNTSAVDDMITNITAQITNNMVQFLVYLNSIPDDVYTGMISIYDLELSADL